MPTYKIGKFERSTGTELKVYVEQSKHVHEAFQNAVVRWLNATRGDGWTFRGGSFQIVSSPPDDAVEYTGD